MTRPFSEMMRKMTGRGTGYFQREKSGKCSKREKEKKKKKRRNGHEIDIHQSSQSGQGAMARGKP